MKRLLTCTALFLGATTALAQFNTAAEVKPILKMIKKDWISVREYEGQDLIYFTLLEVYRCGLDQIRYVVNDGKPTVWQTEPCDGSPLFAEIGEDRLPYLEFPAGHIDSFRVELTYDDGDTEWAEYARDGNRLILRAGSGG